VCWEPGVIVLSNFASGGAVGWCAQLACCACATLPAQLLRNDVTRFNQHERRLSPRGQLGVRGWPRQAMLGHRQSAENAGRRGCGQDRGAVCGGGGWRRRCWWQPPADHVRRGRGGAHPCQRLRVGAPAPLLGAGGPAVVAGAVRAAVRGGGAGGTGAAGGAGASGAAWRRAHVAGRVLPRGGAPAAGTRGAAAAALRAAAGAGGALVCGTSRARCGGRAGAARGGGAAA
jgi:hypothetical protein